MDYIESTFSKYAASMGKVPFMSKLKNMLGIGREAKTLSALGREEYTSQAIADAVEGITSKPTKSVIITDLGKVLTKNPKYLIQGGSEAEKSLAQSKRVANKMYRITGKQNRYSPNELLSMGERYGAGLQKSNATTIAAMNNKISRNAMAQELIPEEELLKSLDATIPAPGATLDATTPKDIVTNIEKTVEKKSWLPQAYKNMSAEKQALTTLGIGGGGALLASELFPKSAAINMKIITEEANKLPLLQDLIRTQAVAGGAPKFITKSTKDTSAITKLNKKVQSHKEEINTLNKKLKDTKKVVQELKNAPEPGIYDNMALVPEFAKKWSPKTQLTSALLGSAGLGVAADELIN